MKKFWIINIGKNPSKSDIIYILTKINFVNINGIVHDFFLSDGSNLGPIAYLKTSNKIIFSEGYNNDETQFGWGELKHYDWFIEHEYKYLGEINLRKEKLKKVNEKFG